MAIKRYQECTLPVKIWRRRHYLKIPYLAYRMWVKSRYPSNLPENWLTWRESKSIATGLVQGDMHWYYTAEEVEDRINKYRK